MRLSTPGCKDSHQEDTKLHKRSARILRLKITAETKLVADPATASNAPIPNAPDYSYTSYTNTCYPISYPINFF